MTKEHEETQENKHVTRGNALKRVGYKGSDDRWLIVENHIVLFGDETKTDLVEEWFSPETDLESDYTKTIGRLAIDFEHGLKVDGPDAPGREDILGYTDWTTAKKTAEGWLVQSMLDRRNKYVQQFEPLIEERLIGTSSEASPEGVRVEKNGHIRRWPLKRNSLTVEPAEPAMLGGNALEAYKALKSLLPDLPGLDDLEAAGETATEGEAGEDVLETEAETKTSQHTSILEEPQMSEENTLDLEGLVTKDEFEAVENDVKSMSDRIDQILEMMAKSPAARGKTIAPDSEEDHPHVKSFGDFLYAVAVGNHKRLTKVYKTTYDRNAFKDLSGNVGASGGVLVPEEYMEQILQVSEFESGVMNRVRVMPTNRGSGTIPALDQYFSPSAGSGDTAFAGGAALDTVAAGDTFTEGDVDFTQLKYRLNKVGEYIEVEMELMDDSPFAIETLLTSLFGMALRAKNERNVLRGTGVGEPLGILNAACAVGIDPDSDNTFAYADAHEMLSRFKAVTNNIAWLVHPSILPDIYGFESSGGASAYQANFQDSPDGVLFGYPIVRSEHLPQADNSGAVILADLGAYLFWQKTGGLAVAYSEHVGFTKEVGTWRFSHRNDGKPWFLNAIELADPQGSYTISPFVYHND